MELRLLGDPFIRSRASPLLSFLAPSVPQSWWLSTATRQWQFHLFNPLKKPRSGFHSTACQSAESSPPAGDSSKSADLDFLEDPKSNPPRSPSGSTFSQRLKTDVRLDNLLDSALDDLPKVRRTPPAEPLSSAALVEDAYTRYSVRQREQRQPGSFAQSMAFPSHVPPSNAPQSVIESFDPSQRSPERAKRQIRSRPSVGRTVEINAERGMDFGKALRNLEIQCAVNKVRQDLARQRFHERPGMKRKRLKSERWRKLFRESFRATVGRVKEMRRKGW